MKQGEEQQEMGRHKGCVEVCKMIQSLKRAKSSYYRATKWGTWEGSKNAR